MEQTENAQPESSLIIFSDDENLEIPECDGTLIITNTKELFLNIHTDFELYGFNHPNKPTPKSRVDVYAINHACKFEELADHLKIKLKNLCFTQHQIISFVTSHPDWLAINGIQNLFFFRRGGDVCTARIMITLNEKQPRIDLVRDLSTEISTKGAIPRLGQPNNTQIPSNPLNYPRLFIPLSIEESLIDDIPV